MKTILHRNLRNPGGYAARGEMPPFPERIHFKFHSAMAAERCNRAGDASCSRRPAPQASNADLPFGRIFADITAARQHVSNEYETIGRNARRRSPPSRRPVRPRDFSL